jgi:serine/threonine protein kinase
VQKPILFGKYYLLERINVGGMAEVFKAKAIGVEGFERLVAVKRILPNIAEDEEFIEMFVDEAKIAVQLTHANIAQIFDLGKVGDSYFIALEYVHGKDLRAIFNRARNRGEPVPLSMACFTIMKICEALDYAHNKKDPTGRPLNFVHRDVSPQNMLISYDGDVKVVDFGIAKAAGKASRTRAGILKGKFGYMSPEQVKGMDIDRRSDVFGVGICLYELLTGERLFAGESDFATVEKVRKVDIMPPSTYNRRIPEELEQIVLKALAGEVDERYQTAMELHEDLESFTYATGHTFNRKDLGVYMRKVFSEELAQELARDQKHNALMVSEISKDQTDDHVDTPDPNVLSLASNHAPYNVPSNTLRPGASAGSSQDSGQQMLRIPYQRFNTLTGIPSVDEKQPRQLQEQEDLEPPKTKPVVPPIVPRPQSIPPSFAQQNKDARPPQFSADWDDELATQIYDKPEVGLDDLSPEPVTPAPDFEERATVPEPQPRNLPQQAPVRTNPLATGQQQPVAQQQYRQAERQLMPEAVAPDVDDLGYLLTPEEFPQLQRSKTPIYIASVVAVMLVVVGAAVGMKLVTEEPEGGVIHLTTLPKDATVKLDDRVASGNKSPYLISNVTPNVTHLLQVSKEGYEPWSLEVVVKPKEVKQLERVTLRPAKSGFSLNSEPSGAKVFIDGVELAQTTPVEVTAISPGSHRIRVEHSDAYHLWEIPINIVAGTVLELPPAKLVPTVPISESKSRTRSYQKERRRPIISEPERPIKSKPEEVKPKDRPSGVLLADGRLRINTRPWSEVSVDGKRIGNTPQMNIELKPGKHTVLLVNEQFSIRKTISVDIVPGETTTKVIDLVPE